MFHDGHPGPKLNPAPPSLLPVFSTHTLPLQTLLPQNIPTGCRAPTGPKWTLSQQRGGGTAPCLSV